MDVFRGIPENICQVIAAVCSSPILPKLDKGSLCGAKAESYAARKGFFSVQKSTVILIFCGLVSKLFQKSVVKAASDK